MRAINWTLLLLWGIYISLLLVLLPHTAWAARQFEPNTILGIGTAWALAIFFEATIAGLTHKASEVIGSRRKAIKKVLNPYMVSLAIAVIISAMANTAHAYEFVSSTKICAGSEVCQKIYVTGFGTILPFASLAFAWVLSGEELSEHTVTDDLSAANKEIRELKKRLGVSEQLFSKVKAERIHAAVEFWPGENNSFYAKVARASIPYVGQILKGKDDGSEIV